MTQSIKEHVRIDCLFADGEWERMTFEQAVHMDLEMIASRVRYNNVVELFMEDHSRSSWINLAKLRPDDFKMLKEATITCGDELVARGVELVLNGRMHCPVDNRSNWTKVKDLIRYRVFGHKVKIPIRILFRMRKELRRVTDPNWTK